MNSFEKLKVQAFDAIESVHNAGETGEAFNRGVRDILKGYTQDLATLNQQLQCRTEDFEILWQSRPTGSVWQSDLLAHLGLPSITKVPSFVKGQAHDVFMNVYLQNHIEGYKP